MKLRVTFTGLCLFAKDRDNNKIHVLMPETRGCCDAHHALIYIHKSHATSAPPSGEEHVPFNFQSMSLDLSDLATNATTLPELPTNIFDAGLHLGATVKRNLIDHPDHTIGRVTLRGGTFLPGPRGGRWKVRSGSCGIEEVEMTNEVVWELDGLPESDLGLDLSNVGSSGNAGKLTIRRSNGVVAFRIYHGDIRHNPTKPGIPKAPADGWARHFDALYQLMAATCTPTPFYIGYERNKSFPPKGVPFCGDLLTCMSAQAPVG